MFRTTLFIVSMLVLATGFTFFVNFDPADNTLPPSDIFYAKEGNPNWLKIKEGVKISAEVLLARHKAELGLGESDALVLLRADEDDLGFTHYRYQHYYKDVKVQGSQLLVHEKDGFVTTLNGRLARRLDLNKDPAISPTNAIEKALAYLPAELYMWENEQQEQLIKRILNDPQATHYPQPELVWVDPTFGLAASENLRLAFSMTIYAMHPESRKWLFVDAVTGEVFHEIEMLHTQVHNTPGVAETKYSGTRSIITDSLGVDSFRLVETTRGRGIETYDLNGNTVIGSAVDFIDDDNYWNNVNAQQDEVATDVHWGAEMTFDYFFQKHNYIGIDGDSMPLVSYVHYDIDFANATWNGMFARFGDGIDDIPPLCALEIVGHEFTHGVNDYTADLVYQDESGALDESFADIFGTSIEFTADPDSADWLIGEDIQNAGPIRNMANPNELNDPDTYFGENWHTGSDDNGGVHINSGVQNFWFYLLTEGGVDTNDIGNIYQVVGLGLDTAGQIAFRNLKYYLY